MWRFTNNKWQKTIIKKRPSLFALVVTDIVEKSGISSFNLLLNVKFEDSQLWSEFLKSMLWKSFSKKVYKLIFRFTKLKKEKFLFENLSKVNVNVFAPPVEN